MSDIRRYRPTAPRRFTDVDVRASLRRSLKQGRSAQPWPAPGREARTPIIVTKTSREALAARQEP